MIFNKIPTQRGFLSSPIILIAAAVMFALAISGVFESGQGSNSATATTAGSQTGGISQTISGLLNGGLTRRSTFIPKPKAPDPGTKGLKIGSIEMTEITPPPLPTITTPPQPACSPNKLAVVLLVDVSGSMDQGDKYQQLKNALSSFTATIPDNSLFGLFTFSDNVEQKVQIGPNRGIRDLTLSKLPLRPAGGTNMRTAFIEVQKSINNSRYLYTGYDNYNLVFFTDGIPGGYSLNGRPSTDCSKVCSNVCFSKSQDPTTSPDIPAQIKSTGVVVHAIGIVDQNLKSCFNNEINNLMIKTASPGNFYSTPNPAQLQSIFANVSQDICR